MQTIKLMKKNLVAVKRMSMGNVFLSFTGPGARTNLNTAVEEGELVFGITGVFIKSLLNFFSFSKNLFERQSDKEMERQK